MLASPTFQVETLFTAVRGATRAHPRQLTLRSRVDGQRLTLDGQQSLDVEVTHVEGVLFDELAPRFDLIAHQDAK